MLTLYVYPWVRQGVILVVTVIAVLMLMRLLFSFVDPNPFGTLGRLVFRFKKFTDGMVHPSASLLARLRINIKVAPLVTLLGACVVGYFVVQLFGNVFATVDGITVATAEGAPTRVLGHALYGLLAVYTLLIVIRIVFSWVMSHGNPVLRVLMRLTDPILEPFRRIIPPLGMFDISPIIVLFLLNFLQAAVAGVFLRSQ
jgi:YggT family protein